MKIFNKFRHALQAAAVLATAGVLTLGSCTKVDDTLGSNLVPDNQQMKAGYVSLPDTKSGEHVANYIQTRLFQTDSIKASNISSGYFGAMLSDTFGLRTAGFLSQYVSYYRIDNDFFGYRPFLDSVQLLLSISSHGADTTTIQKFEVYEIANNDYLTKKPLNKDGKLDTLFYIGFDPEKAPVGSGEQNILGPVLFTFELGGNNGPASKAVRMIPTTAGEDFVKRLMLLEGPYNGKYSIYSADSLKYFVEEFKGLYIKPSQETINTLTAQKGTVYGTELDASGFAVYGRNRVKGDESLVKDTIGMVYYFLDSYAKHGNVSINSVKYDYTQAKFRIEDAREVKPGETDNRPKNPTVFVAGMGGVVTEITFGKEFFDALDKEIQKENDASKKEFRTLAFSQARMSIYFWGSSYDWTNLPDQRHLIAEMNKSQNRLGLYTNYKTLAPITDYAYTYEASFGTELAYGGYINRSRGCYVMDISAYMQELWNSYLKQKEATPAGEQVNLDNVKNRSIYLGPEAYSIYTPSYSVAMGMTGEGLTAGKDNSYPIRFDLTYNMIK